MIYFTTIFHLYRFQLFLAETRRLFHKNLWKGLDDERWEVSLRATHGFVAEARFRSLRAEVQRQLPCQTVLLLRSVPVHGLCSVDWPTQPPRNRNLFKFHESQTVPHWHSWNDRTQYSGPSQPETRLAHLRRLCSDPYHPCSKTLYQRPIGSRFGTDRVRFRFDYHRSLSDPIPLGPISASKSSRQTPRSDRPAGQHSVFCPYFQRENARCQGARSAANRAGCLLCHGSRLHRFCPSVPVSDPHGLLRHAGQKEPPVSSPKESSRGQNDGTTVRSNHRPNGLQHRRGISSVFAPRQVCRSRHRQAPGVSDQQLCARRADDYQAIQVPLASGAFLQMDQETPAHQSVLRHLRQRGEDAGLDCHQRLRLGGDRQKRTQARTEHERNSANFEPQPFRENPAFYGIVGQNRPGFGRAST